MGKGQSFFHSSLVLSKNFIGFLQLVFNKISFYSLREEFQVFSKWIRSKWTEQNWIHAFTDFNSWNLVKLNSSIPTESSFINIQPCTLKPRRKLLILPLISALYTWTVTTTTKKNPYWVSSGVERWTIKSLKTSC